MLLHVFCINVCLGLKSRENILLNERDSKAHSTYPIINFCECVFYYTQIIIKHNIHNNILHVYILYFNFKDTLKTFFKPSYTNFFTFFKFYFKYINWDNSKLDKYKFFLLPNQILHILDKIQISILSELYFE